MLADIADLGMAGVLGSSDGTYASGLVDVVALGAVDDFSGASSLEPCQ